MLPGFRGGTVRPRTLNWEHLGNAAIRRGRWKLVREHPHPWELYDIDVDRAELSNQAARHPDAVAELSGGVGHVGEPRRRHSLGARAGDLSSGSPGGSHGMSLSLDSDPSPRLGGGSSPRRRPRMSKATNRRQTHSARRRHVAANTARARPHHRRLAAPAPRRRATAQTGGAQPTRLEDTGPAISRIRSSSRLPRSKRAARPRSRSGSTSGSTSTRRSSSRKNTRSATTPTSRSRSRRSRD